MQLNIVDVTTSIMRAVNTCLYNMSNIRLTEMPICVREEIDRLVVSSPPDSFTSIISFEEPSREKSKGIIAIYIAPQDIKILFGEIYGINDTSTREEIEDVCGEFCNVIVGRFKKELANLGYGEIKFSLPKNYFGLLNETIILEADCKYKISFSKDNIGFLLVEVAMESAT